MVGIQNRLLIMRSSVRYRRGRRWGQQPRAAEVKVKLSADLHAGPGSLGR